MACFAAPSAGAQRSAPTAPDHRNRPAEAAFCPAAVAERCGGRPATQPTEAAVKISDVMTRTVRTMAESKLQRLPVMDRGKRLVGIVSLGDLAVQGDTSVVEPP
jgi:hypothetical protein